MLEDEKELELKSLLKLPGIPVGIIKIKQDEAWFSFKKKRHFKPDSVKLPYNIAKQYYPKLVLIFMREVVERLLYDKTKFVSLINDFENQEQACLFDFNGQECLVKYYPSEKFQWTSISETDPLLLLEFLELQNFQKVCLVEK